MIIGLQQTISPAGDIPAGVCVIEQALADASRSGIDMLVMPELFLPGYNSVTPSRPPGWDAVIAGLGDMCRRHETALTIGLPEYAPDAVYNAAFVFGPDGTELARYRKAQLFGPREHSLFAAGDQHVVFDHRGVRFGLLICYDVEFPEHTRALSRAGAKVILVPTANMMPFVNVSQLLVPARAAETATTIVYANYCGAEGDLTYTGLSTICGPDGYALAAKGTGPGQISAALPGNWSEHDIPHSTQLADLRAVRDPEV